MEKITIRPSGLATFVSCPRRWYDRHILNLPSPNGVRAIMGTSIHAGAEAMWKEAIKSQDKSNPNIGMMTDVAVEAYDNKVKNNSEGEIFYGDLDDELARNGVVEGVKAFVKDVVPFTPIPLAVEIRVTREIDHCIVKNISGTIDYLAKDTIADIKTSSRKIVPSRAILQQSIYKFLALGEGYDIKRCLIQSVILGKRKVTGAIDELEVNVDQAKYIVNNLLDRLDALNQGVDPNLLFPGNHSDFLCSDKYCGSYQACPYVHGTV